MGRSTKCLEDTCLAKMLIFDRLTEQLWKKVKAYEDLFLQIGPELNSASRTAAQRVLLLVGVVRSRMQCLSAKTP